MEFFFFFYFQNNGVLIILRESGGRRSFHFINLFNTRIPSNHPRPSPSSSKKEKNFCAKRRFYSFRRRHIVARNARVKNSLKKTNVFSGILNIKKRYERENRSVFFSIAFELSVFRFYFFFLFFVITKIVKKKNRFRCIISVYSVHGFSNVTCVTRL